MGLGGFGIGGAVKLRGIGGVVEPDVCRSDEAHEAQGAKAVAQIGLSVPNKGTAHPAERLGYHMPYPTEDADQADPNMTANDVFHGVNTDNPTLAAKGGTG